MTIGKMELAINVAIDSADVQDRDCAAVQLALAYAKAIDDGAAIEKVGPMLLSALDALLLTPRARKVVEKGMNSGAAPASPLDELRARRAKRSAGTNGAATLDSATS